MSMKWMHDDLANDLARHLAGQSDRMVWTNMQMGPAGSPRPDVYTIMKSYAKFTPLAYEVKISVADFRSDITSGKWMKYTNYAAGVLFAVPQGLINKKDIPDGAGLIVRSELGWRTALAPTLQRVDNMPREAWLKLLIDGVQRQQDEQPRPRTVNHFAVEQVIRRRYGDDLAKALRDKTSAEQTLRYMEGALVAKRQSIEKEVADLPKLTHERARNATATVNQALADLCAVLGIPPTSAPHNISAAIYETARRLDENREIKSMRETMHRMRTTLEHGLATLPSVLKSGNLEDCGDELLDA